MPVCDDHVGPGRHRLESGGREARGGRGLGQGLMALTMHAASDLHTTGLLWTACAEPVTAVCQRDGFRKM